MQRAVAIATLLLCPGLAHADDLIDADRPGIADGSHSVRKGHFQVELGIERDDATADQTRFFPTLLRYGVTDSFEMRVESGTFEHSREGNGWGSVSLGFKDHFYERDHLSLGVIGRWFFASGSSDFESNRSYGDLRLTGDMQLGERWSINPNIGVTLGTATAALTVQYNLSPKSNVFIDGNVQKSLFIVDSGAAWIVASNSQLDLSVGWGAHGSAAPRVFWAGGVSHRF